MSDGRPAAVLWDMDGTLLDSEKLWDIPLYEFAEKLGGTLSLEEEAPEGGELEGDDEGDADGAVTFPDRLMRSAPYTSTPSAIV